MKNNNSSSKSGRVACENQTAAYFCVNDFTFQFFSVTNVTLGCCEILFVNLGQLECKLAGWGVTDLEDPKSSQHLMEVTLPWLQRDRFLSHFCHSCHMTKPTWATFVTILSRFRHKKTELRDECNRLFDRDPSTSWIQITNDNLCFGQAAGGIDACQVKKCFACQVITSNKHCCHSCADNDSYHMRHRCC